MIAFLQENRVVGYLSYFEMFEDTYDVDHILWRKISADRALERLLQKHMLQEQSPIAKMHSGAV